MLACVCCLRDLRLAGGLFRQHAQGDEKRGAGPAREPLRQGPKVVGEYFGLRIPDSSLWRTAHRRPLRGAGVWTAGEILQSIELRQLRAVRLAL
jgi:hypothetical protein